MLDNLINIHDLLLFRDKGPELFSILFSKLKLSKQDKIKVAWAHTKTAPTQWGDIPYIRERWNRLISGDSSIDYYEYVSEKYLSYKENLNALSLGCGTGQRELLWAETGKFNSIDAYDLSESRIQEAIRVSKQKGYANIVNFHVDDIYNIEMRHNYYDVILGEHSLHHFSPLEEILIRVSRFLKQDGYFIVNEFVGPTRFQWTNRQLQVINNLLSIFPERYKTLWQKEKIKPSVYKPSRLSMLLRDPSEAIESSRIEPLINQIFEVVEVKPYGGTILHLLFDGIAHNFLTMDTNTQRLLDICFDVEDLLLANNDLKSDFLVAVCKKKGS